MSVKNYALVCVLQTFLILAKFSEYHAGFAKVTGENRVAPKIADWIVKYSIADRVNRHSK